MEKKLGQSSAFPIFLQEGLSNNSHVDMGVSKRFYAACAAMQGILANHELVRIITIKAEKCGMNWMENLAEHSYLLAEELLKQENEATK